MTVHQLGFLLALSGALGLGACKASDAKSGLPPAVASGSAGPPQIERLVAEAPAAPASDGGLSATGTTRPREEAQLGPKATGILAAVLVDEGDHVKKGQVVFRLDASTAELGVQQAKAALSAAEVAARGAELDLTRTQQLFEKAAVSQAAMDNAKLASDSAKVRVEQAKVQVATAERASGDSVVRSPIAGVVAAKLKSTGETVTMMPPTTVVVVQDIRSLEIRVRLPEAAVSRIHAGDPMRVRFPTVGQTRAVTVDRVNPSVDAATRTMEVVGVIDNQNEALKAGMLVEVEFPKGGPDKGAIGAAP